MKQTDAEGNATTQFSLEGYWLLQKLVWRDVAGRYGKEKGNGK